MGTVRGANVVELITPAAPSARRPPTVPLMGLGFAALTEQQTIEWVLREWMRGHGGWICTANVDILRQWRHSAEIREMLSRVDLVVADGMPLVWASLLRGTPLPERVAGSTLTRTLSAAAAEVGASVFLLGGNPGTAAGAARRLVAESPNLRVTGTMCPPFGFDFDERWLSRIEHTVLDAAPDIVYVGLGFPKQERVIDRLRVLLPGTWFVGCGVTFSFVAGEIQRAPAIVQRMGLEWVHRLAQEPRRLSRRYVLEGLPFALQLMSASLVDRSRVPERAHLPARLGP